MTCLKKMHAEEHLKTKIAQEALPKSDKAISFAQGGACCSHNQTNRWSQFQTV